jgi:hypothetical protein
MSPSLRRWSRSSVPDGRISPMARRMACSYSPEMFLALLLRVALRAGVIWSARIDVALYVIPNWRTIQVPVMNALAPDVAVTGNHASIGSEYPSSCVYEPPLHRISTSATPISQNSSKTRATYVHGSCPHASIRSDILYSLGY